MWLFIPRKEKMGHDEQLLRDVNASLKIIRLSGEYSRIARKYFPFSIY